MDKWVKHSTSTLETKVQILFYFFGSVSFSFLFLVLLFRHSLVMFRQKNDLVTFAMCSSATIGQFQLHIMLQIQTNSSIFSDKVNIDKHL